MPKRPKIVGMHVHHSIFLNDAMVGAMNMRAGLRSSRARRPDDPLLAELEARANSLARDVSRARTAAQERLQSFPVDVVVACREGEQPWPDEPDPGFIPRCSCFDNCAIHFFGRDPEAGWKCNCKPCPEHGQEAA